MTEIAVTPRGFRQTKGAHRDLMVARGLVPRFPSVNRPLKADELRFLLDGCRAAILGLDEVDDSVLSLPGLELLVRFGSGVDNVDLLSAAEHGVQVANTPGANAASVAELAVGLMFALGRKLTQMDRAVRQGSWTRTTGFELSGRRLGLVGLGAIGGLVAEKAAVLGMDVVAHDPMAPPGCVTRVELAELLATSDVVSVHCPLTPRTWGLLGEAELRSMPAGAVLVNTARERIVDEAALLRVLEEGHLAGAALDCLDKGSPEAEGLLLLDQVLLTPHAGASTTDAIVRTGVAAVEEVLRLVDGRPLLHPVTAPVSQVGGG
jgi:phosphoglycerate dehydrogenase-like enzyme